MRLLDDLEEEWEDLVNEKEAGFEELKKRGEIDT